MRVLHSCSKNHKRITLLVSQKCTNCNIPWKLVDAANLKCPLRKRINKHALVGVRFPMQEWKIGGIKRRSALGCYYSFNRKRQRISAVVVSFLRLNCDCPIELKMIAHAFFNC